MLGTWKQNWLRSDPYVPEPDNAGVGKEWFCNAALHARLKRPSLFSFLISAYGVFCSAVFLRTIAIKRDYFPPVGKSLFMCTQNVKL